MSSFSITKKKTPFQKHKEEEEARKKVWALFNSYPFWLFLLKRVTCSVCQWSVLSREKRMKEHDYMRNLCSHFKVIIRPGQRLLLEEDWLIQTISWRLILKVSVIDEGHGCLILNMFAVNFSSKIMCFILVYGSHWIRCSFLFLRKHINKSMGLYHSRIAGEKSKDGVSVPKKGSR